MASIPQRGDAPSPSGHSRRPRRENAPDLSFPAAIRGKKAPRLVEPAETWPAWTDQRTYADSTAEPDDWPAWTGDVTFGSRLRVEDLETYRIHPTDGPVLPLQDPDGGDQ